MTEKLKQKVKEAEYELKAKTTSWMLKEAKQKLEAKSKKKKAG